MGTSYFENGVIAGIKGLADGYYGNKGASIRCASNSATGNETFLNV